MFTTTHKPKVGVALATHEKFCVCSSIPMHCWIAWVDPAFTFNHLFCHIVSGLTVRNMADPERVGLGDAPADDTVAEDEIENNAGAIAQILRRPYIRAAIQERLNQEMLEAQTPAVKRRVKSLKKLQLEAINIEAKFYEEVHMLECKYHTLYTPLYTKRGEIISGAYEPNEAECDWESDDEKEDQLSDALKSKAKIEDVAAAEKVKENAINKNDDTIGIPDFWLTIFKNVQVLAEMVLEHDEPILKHLIDIKVVFLQANPMGFVLEFHFSPNPYFSNSVLTKEYRMKCVPDEDDPFGFEGPEIYKCEGCVIDWKKGMNVTVKTIKKKQKHKSRGSVRTVTKTVHNDSFFNFFTPPFIPDDPDANMDDDTQALLRSDFEIGHYIRERIVPRAVLYYTGEALEDEDYEEEGEEEGEEEDDEDGDEEEDGEKDEDFEDDDDEEYVPGKGAKKNKSNRSMVADNNAANTAQCKQQ